MACQADSQCPSGQQCVDGECIDPTGGIDRDTFIQAAGRYLNEYSYEGRQANRYSKFLTAEIEEAVRQREIEAENEGSWGLLGSFVGAVAGFAMCGPGCAVIGAGIGSGTGRAGHDIFTDYEDYGISAEEFASMNEDDFKYLKEEFIDIRTEGKKLQQGLDDYDSADWKRHVMGMIGDTINAYKLINIGTSVAGMIEDHATKKAEEEAAKQAALELAGDGGSDILAGIDPNIGFDIDLNIDMPDFGADLGGQGWSALYGGGDYNLPTLDQ